MVELGKNERIDYLYSDDLRLIQDKTAFATTLDTMFLANYAKNKIYDRYKVVDLCSGNCAATMYMAYFNRAKYDAVEIQDEAYSQAVRSIELNQMENRISVHQDTVLNAPKFLRKDSYDMVVVNPPYFKIPKGHEVNPDKKKAIARHEILINLEQIIETSSALLKMKGKMIMVHRPERLGEICYYCMKHDLGVKVVQPFCSHAGQDSNLIIVEAVKHTAFDGTVLKNTIVVHDQNGDFLPYIQRIIRETKEDREKRLNSGKYYFYVLKCSDGSFYGGFTNDLAHRLKMHNSGKGAKYTKTRRPVKMIYHEEFDDKRLALKREYWFKHHDRKWKEKFLKEHNIRF